MLAAVDQKENNEWRLLAGAAPTLNRFNSAEITCPQVVWDGRVNNGTVVVT